MLNWSYKRYEDFIAVPCECFYKEGLWKEVPGNRYIIKLDFIAGYLDVIGKMVIINSTYHGQHNNTGYEKGEHLCRQNPVIIDNETAKERFVTVKKIDEYGKSILSAIENICINFNIMKTYPTLSEDAFRKCLVPCLSGLNSINKLLPLLKEKI